MSNWLDYTYPASQPDRVPLTTPYDPYSGLAYSVTISAPDKPVAAVTVTPNPAWVDGPVVMPSPKVQPAQPWWHRWHCAHCSWDYTHCSLYNPPNNGTLRSDGYGCRHKHCIPPANIGEATGEDGYQRIIVRVVGYGPRGARKEIEALVHRTTLEYNAEGLVYIQGADDGTTVSMPLTGTPEVTFDGQDNIAFVVTNANDENAINTIVAQPDKVTIAGKGSDFELLDNIGERPKFFASADDARQLVSDLEAEAKIRGRWFTSYPASGNAGSDSAQKLTFVRGDAYINSSGAGVLVVTGTVTLKNNFHGLIMLLGNGKLDLTLASGATGFEGSLILAKFGATGGFLAPEIPMGSTGKYNFKSVKTRVTTAIESLDIHVLGVRNS